MSNVKGEPGEFGTAGIPGNIGNVVKFLFSYII